MWPQVSIVLRLGNSGLQESRPQGVGQGLTSRRPWSCHMCFSLKGDQGWGGCLGCCRRHSFWPWATHSLESSGPKDYPISRCLDLAGFPAPHTRQGMCPWRLLLALLLKLHDTLLSLLVGDLPQTCSSFRLAGNLEIYCNGRWQQRLGRQMDITLNPRLPQTSKWGLSFPICKVGMMFYLVHSIVEIIGLSSIYK